MSNRLQVRGRLARLLTAPVDLAISTRVTTGAAAGSHTTASFGPASSSDGWYMAFVPVRTNAGGYADNPTISDSLGTTWNLIGYFDGPNSSAWMRAGLWWCSFLASQPDRTVTVQTADADAVAIGVNVVRINGGPLKTLFDNIISAASTSGDPSTTLPFANGVTSAISFAAASPASGGFTPPSGWTQTANAAISTLMRIGSANKIGAAGAGPHAWSSSNNNAVGVTVQLRRPSFV